MRRGGLVPDEMVLQILRLELDRVAVAAQRTGQQQAVLLDGYPRTVAQARELDRYLQIHAVVSLNIPHEVGLLPTIPDLPAAVRTVHDVGYRVIIVLHGTQL